MIIMPRGPLVLSCDDGLQEPTATDVCFQFNISSLLNLVKEMSALVAFLVSIRSFSSFVDSVDGL
jgi:hypothetical protein